MRNRTCLLAAFLLALTSPTARAQTTTEREREWNQPVEPFRIVGNLYYVGVREIASYLLATPAGLVLVDSGFEESVPQVLHNVETLGFHPADVKLLLVTQAHYDHVGGMATLRERTAARLLVSAGDAALAARGGKGDPNFGDRFAYRPFAPDGPVVDGQRVELGGSALVAHLTPGHTPGCTTWSIAVKEQGRPLQAVILCSVTAPGYRLVGNAAYPRIVEDFRQSFRTLAALHADVFLAAHASFFDLVEKRALLCRNPEHNPFVDAEALPRHIERQRQAFERQLAEQQAAPRP